MIAQREFEWPATEGISVFWAPDGWQCQDHSDINGNGIGFLCCIRLRHSGAHLHSTGWAWTNEDKTPVRIKLVAA